MKLEGLYKSFNLSSPAEQREAIAEYRTKRAIDMAKPNPWIKKSKGSAKAIVLTQDEKILMNLMKLKKKDILAMRKMREN